MKCDRVKEADKAYMSITMAKARIAIAISKLRTGGYTIDVVRDLIVACNDLTQTQEIIDTHLLDGYYRHLAEEIEKR